MKILLLGVILVAGILNLILGIVITAGSREKTKSLPFALYSFATFLLSLSYYFIHNSAHAVSVRFSYAVGALMPVFLLIWTNNYTGQKTNYWKNVLISLTGIALFALSFVNGPIVSGIEISSDLGFIETRGHLFPLYFGFFVFAYGLVLFRLIGVLRRGDAGTKRQIGVVLSGFSIYGALGIFFGLILPSFGYSRLTDLDVACSVIFVGFTTYAIVQYHWMNVKIIAVEILASLICGVALLETFLAETFSQRIYKSVSFVILALLSTLMVRGVLAEIRRKEKLQTLSDKLAAANDRLQELDQARAEFMSMASHQLQTPLTAIRGYSSLLLEKSDGELTTNQEDMISKIEVSSERMSQLVEDYLNLSRIESGKLEYTFSKCRLDDICQEAVDTLALKAKSKNLHLVLRKPADQLPEVMIDGPKVREVISNLVDNAIKYTPAGGISVDIERRQRMADEEADCLRVTIADTGMGISASDIPKLFAKFSRVKDKEHLQAKGTGLGLYVGKVMIENIGGKIWAESDGEGRGSRFIVEIPIEQSANRGGSASRSAA